LRLARLIEAIPIISQGLAFLEIPELQVPYLWRYRHAMDVVALSQSGLAQKPVWTSGTETNWRMIKPRSGPP
jgi:hypothetical protein